VLVLKPLALCVDRPKFEQSSIHDYVEPRNVPEKEMKTAARSIKKENENRGHQEIYDHGIGKFL
jgi:hypothetical protein